MAELPLLASTISLAGSAADLSSTLSATQSTCGHESTSTDIEAIAVEIKMLSTTLIRLHEAMTEDPDRYTPSFNQDLTEIIKELKSVFGEISECCTELQRADKESASALTWLFKRGKVHYLQKHLNALKTTLVVMRTVLFHGKEYGTQNSPGRLAESIPHTMLEDRVILESVFAKNRNAIIDLHNLETTHQQSPLPSTPSETAERSIARHSRRFSETTGVDSPPIEDVLPSISTPNPENLKMAATSSSPSRSKRLGVHMTILGLGAQETPNGLKEKWVQQRSPKRGHHRRHLSTASANRGSPPLARIVELDGGDVGH